MTTFAELGLSAPVLEALEHLGYQSPHRSRKRRSPSCSRGSDVIGQAQTGTGKTAAFGLPMLEYVDPVGPRGPGAGADPTRELCIQVTQALRAYGERRGDHGGGRLRRRADPRAGLAAEERRPGGGRHRRPRDGHDRPPLPLPRLGPLRGARRGRRDARPRLPRGRRDDPRPLPVRAARPPVLGHDAAGDQEAGREAHVRPGDDQGQGGHAHDRHRRRSSTSRCPTRTSPTSSPRCSRPSRPSRRSSSPAPRSASTASPGASATRACA